MMKKILPLILTLLIISCKEIPKQSTDTEQMVVKQETNPVKKRFAEREAKALEQAFRGIETENGKEDNLFSVQATGVSTLPILKAAKDFLGSLTKDQKARTIYDIDDQEWRKWCNVDNGIYDRQGVSLKEMTEAQKEIAFKLMQVSLSVKGLQLSKDIMKTDQTLKELHNGSSDFDEELYFFTVMGKPSQTEPWGWQLDGHHLIINYFILGDQIVMSPVFMGGEPIFTTTGKYKGNTLFQDEQNMGLDLMKSLNDDQQKKATISIDKRNNSNKAEANKDNINLNYEGLKASELSKLQQEKLLYLAFQYINNIRKGHQQIKMEEVEAHIDRTWFAWVGATDEDSVFYYRIHSPVLLIEFDHQKAVGVDDGDNKGPTRNHIHTVVRTPNGNDYGKDLLRQHKKNHH